MVKPSSCRTYYIYMVNVRNIIYGPSYSLGLEYPTDDVIFDNWWKATLNKAVADTVRLEFNHPSMALIILD